MRLRQAAYVLAVLGLVSVALLHVPIRAVGWYPPSAPSLTGPYARNSALSAVELLPLGDGHGPESIVAGPGGWLYTGLKDGRVVRFRPDGSAVETYANTRGRPNGMKFDRQGNLLVADSFRGLLSIAPDRSVKVLAAGADGQPFTFCDGLDIAADGTVWFSDATSRFPDGAFHYEIMEGSATGRLLTYDPRSGQTLTRIAHLRFPNGVTLGPDDSYVLINEMLGFRTLRHWIKGPRAGQTEPFAENYPGLPDDIRFNGRDLFWIALAAERMRWVDWLQPHPYLKTFLAALFGPFVPDTDARWAGGGAFVLALDLDGNVVRNLQDPERRYVTSTGVLEYKGNLFIGSVVETSVAVIRVPGSSPSGAGDWPGGSKRGADSRSMAALTVSG